MLNTFTTFSSLSLFPSSLPFLPPSFPLPPSSLPLPPSSFLRFTPSPPNSVKLWIVRALTNIAVFVCLASTCYAIFLAVENAESSNTARQRSLNFQTALSRGWHGIWRFILLFQASSYHYFLLGAQDWVPICMVSP